ncbi:MAG: uracil-DNA glycosylase [Bryobacteraceae bacterium]|jgi:uracil-DNA glycosylase family 4
MQLAVLEREILGCELCPRLRDWCVQVARVKRRAFRDEEYWGRPVPGFGDPAARLLIVGLAPGAHGANRTGRVFTGDASGDLLYQVLYRSGFASQAESRCRDDGLRLTGAWITASVRCAPPANKPAPQEIANCRSFLERELALLTRVRVVVALGRVAFDNWLAILSSRGLVDSRAAFLFAHGAECSIPGAPLLLVSYHPSRQNTQTGRLSEDMLLSVFLRAREAIAAAAAVT